MNGKIRLALGFLLGGLFVYAGITKAVDPTQFFVDVQNYDIVPWRAATVALAF